MPPPQGAVLTAPSIAQAAPRLWLPDCHDSHGQSRSDPYTSSLVISSPSTVTGNTVPLPASTAVDVRPTPRRARSDNALPRLVPLRSASNRATARTSSSIVTVTRISATSHRNINLSRGNCSDSMRHGSHLTLMSFSGAQRRRIYSALHTGPSPDDTRALRSK